MNRLREKCRWGDGTQPGSGKKGFEWAAHVTQTLREHMALVTVVSNNDKSAASIFATLNDRGIGLSTVDLIRSFVLQQAPASHREEIIECWDAMFNSCGTNLAAETLDPRILGRTARGREDPCAL